jgi:outer membrane lipoprotein-sorting protein
VFLVLCFSLIQTVWAGDIKALTEAELALKLRQYQSISSIEASFKQTKIIRKMDLRLRSEGYFKVTRPRTLVWQVLKPSPISIFMDPEQVKVVTEGDSQTYKLSDIPTENIARSLKGLLALLDLNAPELSLHYDVFSETGQNDTFKFVPKKGDGSPFQSLTMTLDKSGFVKKVEILEISGDSMSIDFGLPKVTPRKS